MAKSFYRPHKRVQERGEVIHPYSGEITTPPSMTKQEFVRECDINNILKQYSASGMLNHVNGKAAQGAYQDLPDALDFQESLNQVDAARTAFMSLPSKLRARFDNEPFNFLAFCSDPANLAEMRSLGLATQLPPEPPLTSIDVETPPGAASDKDKKPG